MAKKKPRTTRTRQPSRTREGMAFPMLFVLVMGVIALGMFHYSALLAAGSAIFVGFFGWLWWKRRTAAAPRTKMKAPARGKRQPRAR